MTHSDIVQSSYWHLKATVVPLIESFQLIAICDLPTRSHQILHTAPRVVTATGCEGGRFVAMAFQNLSVRR